MVLGISEGSGWHDSLYTRPDRQSSKLSLTICVSHANRTPADQLEVPFFSRKGNPNMMSNLIDCLKKLNGRFL